MKHILLAVVTMLSLVTPGLAGEPSSNCTTDLSPVSEECQKQAVRDRLKWADGDTNEYQWQKLPDGSIRLRAQTNCVEPSCRPAPDCLARMEAAMTSMDRYVKWMILDMELDMDNKQEINRLAQAVKLWAAAKRCWGKP